MRTSRSSNHFLFLTALTLLGGVCAAQELAPSSFEAWLETIRADQDELVWTRIPWRATFWGAVVEAQREEKPILLWAMNGHPLACT